MPITTPISRERILRKWEPIMESIRVRPPLVRFLSEYAEYHHTVIDNHQQLYNPYKLTKNLHPDIDPYGEEDWDDTNKVQTASSDENMLPVAIKMLSKLNLEGKHVFIQDNMPLARVRASVSRQQIDDLRMMRGIDVVARMENTLMEEMVRSINRQLETHDNFRVTCMADSIISTVENNFDSTMILNARYRVD